jgi:hypothetical protein
MKRYIAVKGQPKIFHSDLIPEPVGEACLLLIGRFRRRNPKDPRDFDSAESKYTKCWPIPTGSFLDANDIVQQSNR